MSGVTTKTTSVVWQASAPDGIAHAWLDLRDLGEKPLCRAPVYPVVERWARPIVAKCVICLGHIEYAPRR